MTGYRIEIGYNSGGNYEKVNQKLFEIAEDICFNSDLILKEVKRIESLLCEEEEYDEYLELYRKYIIGENKDLTICIMKNEEDLYYVQQSASGYGISREIKEQLRRAFCRLIIGYMHKEGMEINFIVS